MTEEPPVRPRFELEQLRSERFEAEPLPALVVDRPARGIGTVALGLTGLAVLVGGMAALEIGNFAAAQFARSVALGWVTVGVAATGGGLLLAGVAREVRGLFGMERVDSLRAAMLDPATRREAARTWLATLPEGAALLPAVLAANDPDSILALLRGGPGADLQVRAQALGRTAAVQMLALTAAVPSPALDGLAVAWRGIRLLREVAALHGMRPGLLGTLSLLRRAAGSATQVAATNWAADTAVRAVLSNPLLGHVAGDLAGAGVAARRMMVLARAAEAACSPLPPA